MAVDFIKPSKNTNSLLVKKRGYDFYKPAPQVPSMESLNAKLAEDQAKLEEEKALFLKEKESFQSAVEEIPALEPRTIIRRKRRNELS